MKDGGQHSRKSRRSEEAHPAKALQAARPESQWKGTKVFFTFSHNGVTRRLVFMGEMTLPNGSIVDYLYMTVKH